MSACLGSNIIVGNLVYVLLQLYTSPREVASRSEIGLGDNNLKTMLVKKDSEIMSLKNQLAVSSFVIIMHFIHSFIHAYIHTHTHAHAHAHANTRTHARDMRIYIHTQIHSNIHTYIHRHTYMDIHVHSMDPKVRLTVGCIISKYKTSKKVESFLN
jgi:hypothetical protein